MLTISFKILSVKSFSYDKDIWIALTDYYMHFYIIVLFPLTAIFQLVNFTASNILVY